MQQALADWLPAQQGGWVREVAEVVGLGPAGLGLLLVEAQDGLVERRGRHGGHWAG